MKWYLDFGHGGKDSGAIGPTNLKESDIALKIGMMVKETLENALEKVITTREDDKYYSLDYRTKKANNENCDYFISIHLNSATNTSAKDVKYGYMMIIVNFKHTIIYAIT